MTIPLDIPAELITRITGAVMDRNGKRQRNEVRFRCVNPSNHRNGDADPSARWNIEKAVWRCDVCGDGGGAFDLAERLGIEYRSEAPRLVMLSNGNHPPATLASWAAERHLPLAMLVEEYLLTECTHQNRPAARYPTSKGERIRYLDGQRPKAKWATSGAQETVYNLKRAMRQLRGGQDALYLVNGEPSVWACASEGVAAICLCVGEKAPSPASLTILAEVLGTVEHPVRVRVAYDRDRPGQEGARAAVSALRSAGLTAAMVQLPADLGESGDVDDLHRIVGDRLLMSLAALPDLDETPEEEPEERDRRQWKVVIDEPEVEPEELPVRLESLVTHALPLARMFPTDWPVMMALPFWSAMWPTVRMQNLNLCIWTLGLGDTGSGKNLSTDELKDVAFDVVVRALPEPPKLFTTGTPQGIWDSLDGERRSLLAYQDEFAGFLQMLKREHMFGARETLCSLYDGRGFSYVRARNQNATGSRPYVTMCVTTTVHQFREHATLADLTGGYLNRFMFCCPDQVNIDRDAYYYEDDQRRRELVESLSGHIRRHQQIVRAVYDQTGKADPPIVREYARHLGIGTGETLTLEDQAQARPMPGGRFLARVKKIAALLALAESPPVTTDSGTSVVIATEHIEMAIRIVERGWAYARRVEAMIGESTDYALSNLILRLLRDTPGGLTQRELCRRTKAKASDVGIALKLLGSDGRISSNRNGRGERWMVA